MFRKFMLLAGVVGMVSVACADTYIPQGNVSGTWAAAGSPFLIMGEITVPGSQTLNIEPGVQVIFQGHYKLIVNGLLEAIGTEQDSILFTALDTIVGWWGIRFIHAVDSSRLDFCIIEHGCAPGNSTTDPDTWGGGIFCDQSNPVITHCLIANNSAFRGGGIATSQSEGCGATIACCVFYQNSARNNGGAMFLTALGLAVSIEINSCGVVSNTSEGEGGGLTCSGNLQIKNCQITGNTAVGEGGGVRFAGADVVLTNCTLRGNSSAIRGGGLCIVPWSGSDIDLSGCIVWANAAGAGSQIYLEMPTDLNCVFSDIQGSWPGTGNINADPLFVSGPDGEYYLSQIAAGQSRQSPCVEAGDPASPMIDGTTRTDGVPDLGIVDMGCHYPTFGPSPPVTINLTPFNPPIVIPAGGGWFAFLITIDNSTDSSQTFDGWTKVQLPNGSQIQIIDPVSITLPPTSNLFRARDQFVPANAPAGSYLYWGFVGTYPSNILDSHCFPFRKLGSNRDWLGAEGWVCSGEPFDAEAIAPQEGAQSAAADAPTLHGALPNPFNPTTVASYELPAASYVKLAVYDISGREVAVLANGWREAGAHEVTFDATGLAAGIYFARLEAGEYVGMEKIVLLK